jgi:hypothetical protein
MYSSSKLTFLIFILLLASLTSARSQSNVPPTASPKPIVWFCPEVPFLIPWTGFSGSPQYFDLFQDNSEWPHAEKHVQVFKIYGYLVQKATDSQLQSMFAYLKRHNIALAFEFGLMSRPEGGEGVEGFGGESLLGAVQKIEADGGDLKYVAMDEPLYYGGLYRGPGAPAWSQQQVVDNITIAVKALHAVYPNIEVGDIEPFGAPDDSDVCCYSSGIAAMEKSFGAPLPFFDLDIDWGAPHVFTAIGAMRDGIRKHGVPWGMIYNGDGPDSSSAQWLGETADNAKRTEIQDGTPDIVIFQSWTPQPKILLPEEQQDSFTHLINWYFLPRPVLTIHRTGNTLEGTARLSNGQPVQFVNVTATAEASGDLVSVNVTHHGIVPPGTQFVIFGLRGNLENTAVGPIDATINSYHFAADGNPPIDEDFNMTPNPAMRMKATPAEHILHNEPPIPLTSTGSYTFTASVIMTRKSQNNGFCAMIFMGDKGEICRDVIPFVETPTTIGTAKTSSRGKWEIKIPSADRDFDNIQATYPGSESYWPAECRLH